MNRPDYSVSDLGELVTLITTDIVEGANVWVESDGAYWTLEKNSGVAPGPTVLVPLTGAPQAGASNARWLRNVGGGGGGPTGDPNAIAFFNPAGATLIDDPLLVAAPIDAFGRPQIWDHRQAAGKGSVWREGAWQADGDPSNQKSEGIVCYGANANDVGPTLADGGYARVKPNRFGLAQILGGGGLFYAIRLDNELAAGGIDGIQMKTDGNVESFRVQRSSGNVFFGDGSGVGTARMFGNASGPLHSSNAGIQYSSLVQNRAQIRCNAYGNVLPQSDNAPGQTGFRSRGASIGALAPVLAGDILWRATAIGVTDNLSIPLSGLLTFLAKTVPPAGGRIGCDLQVQQSPSTAAQRITWTFEGETGALDQAFAGQRIRIKEGANAMQGVAVTGALGTILVANTLITANTRISLTGQSGGVLATGGFNESARVPGASFTIQATAPADVGVNVFWQLWEPAP